MEKKYPIGDEAKLSILKKHYFAYYRPSFPSDERTTEVVNLALSIKEETEAIFKAMDEYAANPQGIRWVKGDYERLYDKLKAEPERKIVCWVNYEWGLRGERKELLRDICSIMGRVMGFNARGIGYGGCEIWIGEENEKQEFLKECARLNVQWLDESAGEKEVENE